MIIWEVVHFIKVLYCKRAINRGFTILFSLAAAAAVAPRTNPVAKPT
jgi:hypothetical protein